MSQPLRARPWIFLLSSLCSYVPFSSLCEGPQGSIPPLRHSLSHLTSSLEGILNVTCWIPIPTSAPRPHWFIHHHLISVEGSIVYPGTEASNLGVSLSSSLPTPPNHTPQQVLSLLSPRRFRNLCAAVILSAASWSKTASSLT